MFHRHRWEEKDVIVAEPLSQYKMGTVRWEDSPSRALIQGTVTYVLKCDCGDMRKIECIGERKK